MKWLSRKMAVALTVLTLTSSAAFAADKKDIVDTAVGAGSFKTLAAALQAADLVDALKSKGPFTVFAPTDAAFAKLPKGTVETLLKPENKATLQAVLKYHVVSGNVEAKDVVKLKGAVTLNGQRIDIVVADGKVKADKANVVKTDIACSNGVIHVIDSVILPSSTDIVETAANAGSFKTLLAAAKAAGLVDALTGKGPLTVFAPTDDAFAKLPKGTVASLLKPENKDKLVAILKYHVLSGRVYSEQAVAAKKATTLQGGDVHISVAGGKARINKANLVATDIDASNGVIHVIDSVLLPSADKKISKAEVKKMIELTVAKGSHLYNSGDHAGCAKLYRTSMQRMLTYGDQMPVLTSMRHSLSRAGRTHCPTEQSWTLRRGLDHVYYRMVAR